MKNAIITYTMEFQSTVVLFCAVLLCGLFLIGEDVALDHLSVAHQQNKLDAAYCLSDGHSETYCHGK